MGPKKKGPQVVLPAARHYLDCASLTASRPLPEEVQEEAKAQAVINASSILAVCILFYLNHNICRMSIYISFFWWIGIS